MPCSGAVLSVPSRDTFTYCSEQFLLPRFAVAFIKKCFQYHSPFMTTMGLVEMMCPSFLPISRYYCRQCTDVLSDANTAFGIESMLFEQGHAKP